MSERSTSELRPAPSSYEVSRHNNNNNNNNNNQLEVKLNMFILTNFGIYFNISIYPKLKHAALTNL